MSDETITDDTFHTEKRNADAQALLDELEITDIYIRLSLARRMSELYFMGREDGREDMIARLRESGVIPK